MENLLNRFLDYIKIDTESDPESKKTPSTQKQFVLAKKLVEALGPKYDYKLVGYVMTIIKYRKNQR